MVQFVQLHSLLKTCLLRHHLKVSRVEGGSETCAPGHAKLRLVVPVWNETHHRHKCALTLERERASARATEVGGGSRQLSSTPFFASLTHHGLKSSGLSCVGTVFAHKPAITGAKLGSGLPLSSGLFSTIGVRHFGFAVSCSTAADAHVREEASSLPLPAVEEKAETASTAEQAASLSGAEIVDDEDGKATTPYQAASLSGAEIVDDEYGKAITATRASPGGKFAVHPWAEWSPFLELLQTQGYFEHETVQSKKDITALKMAFRNFARLRDDIYSNLPRTELEVLAGAGCANTQRKTVSAAKRLRHELGIKEFLVCDDCAMRSECKRAYQDAASEEPVSTGQVVRLILQYGLNAWDDASSVPLKTKTAAEALLRELTKLGSIPRDPSLPPPPAATQYGGENSVGEGFGWMVEGGKKGVAERKARPRTGLVAERRIMATASRFLTDAKPGDWVCQECNYSNFARNRICRGCEADAPPNKTMDRSASRRSSDEYAPARDGMRGMGSNRSTSWERDADDSAVGNRRMQQSSPRPPSDALPGDWVCPECNYSNFARNQKCRECEADAPPRRAMGRRPPPGGSSSDYQRPPRDGMRGSGGYRSTSRERDWDDSPAPNRRMQPDLLPGDWVCTECNYTNFAKNQTCRACNASGASAGKSSNDSYGRRGSTRDRGSDSRPRERQSFGSDDGVSYELIPFGDREWSVEEVIPRGGNFESYGKFAPYAHKYVDDDVRVSELPAARAYERDWDDKPRRSAGSRRGVPSRGWEADEFQEPTPIPSRQSESRDGGRGSRGEGIRPPHDEFKPDWGKVSEPRDLSGDDADEDDAPSPQRRVRDVGFEGRPGPRQRYRAGDKENEEDGVRTTFGDRRASARNDFGLGGRERPRERRMESSPPAVSSRGRGPSRDSWDDEEGRSYAPRGRGGDGQSAPRRYGERPENGYRNSTTRYGERGGDGESVGKRFGERSGYRGGRDDGDRNASRSSSYDDVQRKSFPAPPNTRSVPARNGNAQRQGAYDEKDNVGGWQGEENDWGSVDEDVRKDSNEKLGGGRFLPQRRRSQPPRKSQTSSSWGSASR